MNCETCINWETIPTNGSARGDEGMLKNDYRNCLMNKKHGDSFAAFKFVHATYTCDKYEVKK